MYSAVQFAAKESHGPHPEAKKGPKSSNGDFKSVMGAAASAEPVKVQGERNQARRYAHSGPQRGGVTGGEGRDEIREDEEQDSALGDGDEVSVSAEAPVASIPDAPLSAYMGAGDAVPQAVPTEAKGEPQSGRTAVESGQTVSGEAGALPSVGGVVGSKSEMGQRAISGYFGARSSFNKGLPQSRTMTSVSATSIGRGAGVPGAISGAGGQAELAGNAAPVWMMGKAAGASEAIGIAKLGGQARPANPGLGFALGRHLPSASGVTRQALGTGDLSQAIENSGAIANPDLLVDAALIEDGMPTTVASLTPSADILSASTVAAEAGSGGKEVASEAEAATTVPLSSAALDFQITDEVEGTEDTSSSAGDSEAMGVGKQGEDDSTLPVETVGEKGLGGFLRQAGRGSSAASEQTSRSEKDATLVRPSVAQSGPEESMGGNDGDANLQVTKDPASQATTSTLDDVQTKPDAPVNSREVIHQVVQKMKLGTDENGIKEMRIQLKPDFLGDVRVKVTVENGVVSARFAAESHQVKAVLETSWSSLKEHLEQQGLRLGDFSVDVMDMSGNSGQDGGFDQSSHRTEWVLGETRPKPRNLHVQAESRIVSTGQVSQGRIDFLA